MREAPPNASSGLQAPPAFLERPKEEYFQEVGRELLIPCSARGDPPPTVSWAKVRLLSPFCLCSAHYTPVSLPLAILWEGRYGKGRAVRGRVGRKLALPREISGALGEGWLRVSSGLTSGSVGGPWAAEPGPGGQQQ